MVPNASRQFAMLSHGQRRPLSRDQFRGGRSLDSEAHRLFWSVGAYVEYRNGITACLSSRFNSLTDATRSAGQQNQ
jgi:hypothetical protein